MQFTTSFLLAAMPALIAAAFPAGYTSMGCYAEPKNLRALGPKHFATGFGGVGPMTLEVCSSLCQNYKYFGTENFDECYCGNWLMGGATADASNCQSTCPGNTAETCGGYGYLSLYSDDSVTVPAAPPTIGSYALVGTGCQTDGLNNIRALSADSFTDVKGMTNEACAAYCGAKNYLFFGTENSIECWCDNKVSPDSTQRPLGECDMQCPTVKTQLCGGFGRMNMYSYVAQVVQSSTVVAPIIPPTPTVAPPVAPTSSAVESHAVAPPVNAPAIPPSSTTMMTSTITAVASSSEPAITTVASSSEPTITTAPEAFESFGCFKDHRKFNMIPITTASLMNPSLCVELAQAYLSADPPTTYSYIGVEAASKCFAATAIPPTPTSLIGRKACTKICLGSPGEICGGRLQYNLYATPGAPTYTEEIVTMTA